MDIALREVCMRWYRRYRTPLPYHTLVDPETLRECMQVTSIAGSRQDDHTLSRGCPGVGSNGLEPAPPEWNSV